MLIRGRSMGLICRFGTRWRLGPGQNHQEEVFSVERGEYRVHPCCENAYQIFMGQSTQLHGLVGYRHTYLPRSQATFLISLPTIHHGSQPRNVGVHERSKRMPKKKDWSELDPFDLHHITNLNMSKLVKRAELFYIRTLFPFISTRKQFTCRNNSAWF